MSNPNNPNANANPNPNPNNSQSNVTTDFVSASSLSLTASASVPPPSIIPIQVSPPPAVRSAIVQSTLFPLPMNTSPLSPPTSSSSSSSSPPDSIIEIPPTSLLSAEVSSHKTGCGVPHLFDNDNSTYWQSDSPHLPHHLLLTLYRKVLLSHIAFYIDAEVDESYTPCRIGVECGDYPSSLSPLGEWELSKPSGWVILHVKVRCSIILFYVKSSQQNGRDCHIRQMKLFSYQMERRGVEREGEGEGEEGQGKGKGIKKGKGKGTVSQQNNNNISILDEISEKQKPVDRVSDCDVVMGKEKKEKKEKEVKEREMKSLSPSPLASTSPLSSAPFPFSSLSSSPLPPISISSAPVRLPKYFTDISMQQFETIR